MLLEARALTRDKQFTVPKLFLQCCMVFFYYGVSGRSLTWKSYTYDASKRCGFYR